MNKKVIFIGGTSFSGSTLLDLMLSNSNDAFSCGEINALFYPYASHHLSPKCGCGNPQCTIWQQIQKFGEKRLYESIFRQFPSVSTIVDSSKDPLWIRDQTKRLEYQGLDVRQILIWKSPAEFRKSRAKRRKESGWEQSWIAYHRYYFRMIPNWISVSYSDLVNDPTTFQSVTNRLGLPYFEGKARYWTKTHHTLFGNNAAKISLYDEKSELFTNAKKERQLHATPMESNSMIAYRSVMPQVELEQTVSTEPYTLRELNSIRFELLHRDVSQEFREHLPTIAKSSDVYLWRDNPIFFPFYSIYRRTARRIRLLKTKRSQ